MNADGPVHVGTGAGATQAEAAPESEVWTGVAICHDPTAAGCD